MNILIASSRGGGLDRHVESHIHVESYVHPGANIDRLTRIVKHKIPPPYLNTTPTHVYLLTGIPDITQKIKGGSHHKPYTEYIYTGNTRVTVSNIKDKLDQFEKAVKDKKATPIFCTITNMNIQLYNEHLLKTHKTHTLHHTANYHKVQPLIDTIIYQVNYYIIGKNIANKVSTPYFHSVIRTKKGNKRKHSKFYYTDNWGGLSDGVHGTYDTRLKWAKCLSNSIDLNRGTNSKLKHSIDNMETNNKRKHSTDDISSDDEPHSPKRSWRRDRTN